MIDELASSLLDNFQFLVLPLKKFLSILGVRFAIITIFSFNVASFYPYRQKLAASLHV